MTWFLELFTMGDGSVRFACQNNLHNLTFMLQQKVPMGSITEASIDWGDHAPLDWTLQGEGHSAADDWAISNGSSTPATVVRPMNIAHRLSRGDRGTAYGLRNQALVPAVQSHPDNQTIAVLIGLLKPYMSLKGKLLFDFELDPNSRNELNLAGIAFDDSSWLFCPVH